MGNCRLNKSGDTWMDNEDDLMAMLKEYEAELQTLGVEEKSLMRLLGLEQEDGIEV